ncbi:phage tail tube protein [Sneathiella marina]|uniref:Phage tail tube protein n=1 Tax=Sneathiella marina TaxID=2950108 RepID=A0ABY4VYW8_9PROT|nr:phage tail tube protein [Sneathiella marina]USG59934.1 phage tail tube protein [Sneathiella marina]
MRIASGARHGLFYTREAAFGEIPSAPQMTVLRHTSCDIGLSKTLFEADEIRADRQQGGVFHGQESVSGDLGFELAAGAFDDLLAAALQSDWSSDILKTGTNQPSFTLERAFRDIGTYQRLTGCVVDKLSLSIKPDALVRGQFSMIGQAVRYATDTLDATPVAAPASAPFDSFSAAVLEGGNPLAIVAGLDLLIENDLAPTYVVGAAAASSIYAGKSTVSGEMLCFFESAGLLEKFRAGTASSLQITLDSNAGNLTLTLPDILYTGADNAVPGDGPVTLTLPFTARFDAATGSNLMITRSIS